MGFFSFLDPALNFALDWMLRFDPLISILILSLVLSVLITLAYKYTTNQDLMKSLKDELKSLQVQMRELKHDPSKMMEVNKRAMEANMKYMTHSFRPMLFTFLPIILVFGWLNGHFAFESIHPGQEFTMTIVFDAAAAGNITAHVPDGMTLVSDATRTISEGSTIFTFKGVAGIHAITFDFGDRSYVKEVEITEARHYIEPTLTVNDGSVKSITTAHEKTKVIHIGSFGITWLWSYIIFSIVFSMLLRKWLKVY